MGSTRAHPIESRALRARVGALKRIRRLATERERLLLATEASAVATWDFYPQTGVLFWDARAKEMLGVPPETSGGYDTFLEAVHPDDREETNRAVQRALDPSGTGEYRIQYRMIGIR